MAARRAAGGLSATPGSLGRYQLKTRLGEGGMGAVYLAVDPAGRAVAVKMVRQVLTARWLLAPSQS